MMRDSLRRLAPKLHAGRVLADAVESNNPARVSAALLTWHLIDRTSKPRIYSREFKAFVVADCVRYGVRRSSILNGTPFSTVKKWWIDAKRRARKGKTMGSEGGAPTSLHAPGLRRTRKGATRPKGQVKGKIAAKIAALLSKTG